VCVGASQKPAPRASREKERRDGDRSTPEKGRRRNLAHEAPDSADPEKKYPRSRGETQRGRGSRRCLRAVSPDRGEACEDSGGDEVGDKDVDQEHRHGRRRRAEPRLGRIDRSERGQGGGEGAEEDGRKQKAAPSFQGAPEDEALHPSIQIAEVAQTPARFFET